MKSKFSIQLILVGLLLIPLLISCTNRQTISIPVSSPAITATTEPNQLLEVMPTLTRVPIKPESTSSPINIETPTPSYIRRIGKYPVVTTKISTGLEEELYLYLNGEKLYRYNPQNNQLSPFAHITLDAWTPYLSPDGKLFYWVKDQKLYLFDNDQAKTIASYVLPKESGGGDGWTYDGEIRLIRLTFTEDSELTKIIYTFFDPTDFHVIKRQSYELNNYPHFTVGMKYGFAAISPDGSKVLYSGLDELKEYVFLYDSVKSQVLWKSEEFNLVDNLGYRANTIWTNDGKWAIFSAIRKESHRSLFAISADGTVFKELAGLDSAIFEGDLRSIQISNDSDYIIFSLWDTLAQLSESSAAIAGKGYLLDLKEGGIKTVCLKDQLFLNGVFHRNSLIYDVFNTQSKNVEVWVLEPKLWQAKKMFEFSTDGVYYVIGKNFAFR